MMKCSYLFGALLLTGALLSCTAAPSSNTGKDSTAAAPSKTPEAPVKGAVPKEQRKQVPILCYHNIKETVSSKSSPDYTISVSQFKAQIKMLADSGYHTVLPEQLYSYLTTGAPLPSKPIMITFDDTHLEHYTVAAPELEKYGFKGVFFAMTISINRPHYMTADNIKALSNKGHQVASHTWDHANVRKLPLEKWDEEVEKPRLRLEQITGKPIIYFAYPFGEWNDTAVQELEKHHIKAAFQLSSKISPAAPLLTIRRILALGNWSPATLNARMHNSFP